MCRYTLHHYPACGHIANFGMESCVDIIMSMRYGKSVMYCENSVFTHDVVIGYEANNCRKCKEDPSARPVPDSAKQWQYTSLEGMDLVSNGYPCTGYTTVTLGGITKRTISPMRCVLHRCLPLDIPFEQGREDDNEVRQNSAGKAPSPAPDFELGAASSSVGSDQRPAVELSTSGEITHSHSTMERCDTVNPPSPPSVAKDPKLSTLFWTDRLFGTPSREATPAPEQPGPSFGKPWSDELPTVRTFSDRKGQSNAKPKKKRPQLPPININILPEPGLGVAYRGTPSPELENVPNQAMCESAPQTPEFRVPDYTKPRSDPEDLDHTESPFGTRQAATIYGACEERSGEPPVINGSNKPTMIFQLPSPSQEVTVNGRRDSKLDGDSLGSSDFTDTEGFREWIRVDPEVSYISDDSEDDSECVSDNHNECTTCHPDHDSVRDNYLIPKLESSHFDLSHVGIFDDPPKQTSHTTVNGSTNVSNEPTTTVVPLFAPKPMAPKPKVLLPPFGMGDEWEIPPEVEPVEVHPLPPVSQTYANRTRGRLHAPPGLGFPPLGLPNYPKMQEPIPFLAQEEIVSAALSAMRGETAALQPKRSRGCRIDIA